MLARRGHRDGGRLRLVLLRALLRDLLRELLVLLDELGLLGLRGLLRLLGLGLPLGGGRRVPGGLFAGLDRVHGLDGLHRLDRLHGLTGLARLRLLRARGLSGNRGLDLRLGRGGGLLLSAGVGLGDVRRRRGRRLLRLLLRAERRAARALGLLRQPLLRHALLALDLARSLRLLRGLRLYGRLLLPLGLLRHLAMSALGSGNTGDTGSARALAPRAGRRRHEQQVLFLGHRGSAAGAEAVGRVREGVGAGGRNARLTFRLPACVLRQSLSWDLAGVSHAFPSPIASAPSNPADDRHAP
ncbi:hypothetical protein [Streptomyces sp. NPDC048172]|uniref:hypothetical protein n=1 Tax=Streptomyces sp. NPDC048172 TaxID=3365505 RepID=UPI0037158CAF